MKTSLVKIGNSKGVRLPKAVIEQSQLTDELELEVGDGVVVLRNSLGSKELAAGRGELSSRIRR